jgi:hypothetical protein
MRANRCLCETCLNRDEPKTRLIEIGSNVRCKEGFKVNRHYSATANEWVFPRSKMNECICYVQKEVPNYD